MSAEAVPVGWVPTIDTFGARLALIRQRMSWNAKEAAINCGVPQQSWREWEGGRSPRNQEEMARKIARATGCDFLWLFAGVSSRDGGNVGTGMRTDQYRHTSGGSLGKTAQVIALQRRYQTVATRPMHAATAVPQKTASQAGRSADAA